MKIYESEKNDGVDSAVVSNSSIAFCSHLLPNFDTNSLDSAITNGRLGCGNLGIGDLFAVKNIYVTIGWNNNDDIFDKHETWAARKTLANKPFNMHHKPRDIIGHIIDSFGYTLDHNVVPDNVEQNELPNNFHLVTQSVIYRSVDQRDDDLKQEREKLIEEILAGEWYVSMECLFDDFDYGLRSSTGEHSIVKRGEDTAFLTKHLRVYGGSGIYGSAKIGRVLRNQHYIGKGLVKNPANPESVFLFGEGNVYPFVGQSLDQAKTSIVLDNYLQGDESMADNQELLTEYKSRVDDLEKDLANANDRLHEMGEQSVQAKLNAKDSTIAALQDKNTEHVDRITELEASLKELEGLRDAAVASKIEAEEKLAQAEEKIGVSEAEAMKISRVSTLVDNGVEKVEAEKVVDKFSDLDDEKFEDIVAMQKQIVDNTNGSTSDETGEGSTDKDDEDDVSGEANADEEGLDNLEEEEDADLSSSSDNDEEKQVKMQALANDISEYIHGSRVKSDNE